MRVLGVKALRLPLELHGQPALALPDTPEEIVWKQGVGLSGEAPLDLGTAEARIRRMGDKQP